MSALPPKAGIGDGERMSRLDLIPLWLLSHATAADHSMSSPLYPEGENSDSAVQPRLCAKRGNPQ